MESSYQVVSKSLTKGDITGKFLLHFRGVIIIGMNDFVYRRRLLSRVADARLNVLSGIKSVYEQPEKYSDSRLSMLRDEVIMSGPEEPEFNEMLRLESIHLPPSQNPEWASIYASIMNDLQAVAKGDDSSILVRKIERQYDEVSKLPNPNEGTWLCSYIKDKDGNKVGLVYASPSKEVAEDFKSAVAAVQEGELAQKDWGFKALHYLSADTVRMSSEEFVANEADILRQIKQLKG